MELSSRASEIADHARFLLAEGGYNGFSYADLSERVHIGKSSIHHHFPSKAELVLTVVIRHREQTRHALAALAQQAEGPLAQLTAYTDYWAQCIREGQSLSVKLADGWMVSAVKKANISDIKPGDFVGIASLPKSEGGDGALEVLIFPPALKGTGEGSYGWDLKPNSTMTNATVGDAVKSVDGSTVTVSYHGKEKKISIPNGTPVVTLAPATAADVTSGTAVFIPAQKDSNGMLSAGQLIVGKDGVVPPM